MKPLELQALKEIEAILSSFDTYQLYAKTKEVLDAEGIEHAAPIMDEISKESSKLNQTVRKAYGWVKTLIDNEKGI